VTLPEGDTIVKISLAMNVAMVICYAAENKIWKSIYFVGAGLIKLSLLFVK